MDAKGNLILDFFDVEGNRPDDRVDVFLKHTTLSTSLQLRDQRTTKRLRITDLDSTQGGTYIVQVFPFRHRPVGRFVRILEDQTVQQSFVLPVDPARISRVEFPSYDELGDDLKQVLRDSEVEGSEEKHGPDLYQVLDSSRKAGLLNIYAKMKATRFQNDRDV